MAINVKRRNVQKDVEEIFWNCSKCSREIVGITPEQVKYNAQLHLQKHKKKTKQAEEPKYTY